MTTKTRVAKIDAQVKKDLEADLKRRLDEFLKITEDEDFQAWLEVWAWLDGRTHKPRPKPIVWAKAIKLRERMPHDLIEAYRRTLIARGTKPEDLGDGE